MYAIVSILASWGEGPTNADRREGLCGVPRLPQRVDSRIAGLQIAISRQAGNLGKGKKR